MSGSCLVLLLCPQSGSHLKSTVASECMLLNMFFNWSSTFGVSSSCPTLASDFGNTCKVLVVEEMMSLSLSVLLTSKCRLLRRRLYRAGLCGLAFSLTCKLNLLSCFCLFASFAACRISGGIKFK